MIKERLLALPNEIAEIKMEVLKKQEQAAEIRELMNQWELAEVDEIANAVDDKGKPVFSNDAKRKAELEKRKNAFQSLIGRLKTIQQGIPLLFLLAVSIPYR